MYMKESIQSALDYMEEQLEEDLLLEKVADKALMSLPNLYRGFYSLTGHTLKNYMRKRRVSTAAWHLRYSKRSIVEIAMLSGFGSDSSLSKIFKKVTGMSPGAYRMSDLHYSFERIRLSEKVRYSEDKELTDHFPNVKVIRMEAMRVQRRLYHSDTDKGIEREALYAAYAQLEGKISGTSKLRYLGRNVDLSSGSDDGFHYGYEIIIPIGDEDVQNDHQVDHDVLPGGLYAVCSVTAAKETEILHEWNRLQAEWLPKSVFSLGRHPLIEEFVLYGDRIVRMKIYLPIERKKSPDFIEIRTISPMRVASFRSYGGCAQQEAEERLLAWCSETCNPEPLLPYRCYISYQYGISDGEDYWWEAGLSAFQEPENTGTGVFYKTIGGGEYACIVTKALGSLYGIVEKLHQWLYESKTFDFDNNRDWFIEYDTTVADLDENCKAVCLIPVIKKSRWSDI